MTNPNCPQCRELFKEGVCEGYDTELVLIPQVQTDEHLFRIIWSTKDSKITFGEMLMGKDISQTVDFNLDIKNQSLNNNNMLIKLNSISKIGGTPSFFIDDGIEIKCIQIPKIDIKEIIKKEIERNFII